MPQLTVERNLTRLFGLKIQRSNLSNLKAKAAEFYSETRQKLLDRIVHGNLIHADETNANIKGQLAYVWVLTNMNQVVYILSDSREGEMVRDLLKDFRGVLVSDFYAAYDRIECHQQRCLIHLMRDLNDEVLNNPFDEQMKSIVSKFGVLLKEIVEAIDRRGLKKHFLRKYRQNVAQFYRFLLESRFTSEPAEKCRDRFLRNREKLFTFIEHDGVPWNNNNAEHAIKAFSRIRRVIAGTSTKRGLEEYLVLLSIAQTCEYQQIDFLNFLRSGEKDVDAFAQRRGPRRQRTKKTPREALPHR
jgi:hypothetical protein